MPRPVSVYLFKSSVTSCINIIISGRQRSTALHIAAKMGHHSVMLRLLNAGIHLLTFLKGFIRKYFSIVI